MANLKEPRGYEEDFDSDWYLTTVYGSVEGNKAENISKFYLDFFHDTFASGNICGEKLLDIGTGPSVHSVISASPYVTEIHLSDFADKHRQILKKWLDGGPNVPACFEYFLNRENKRESVESRNKMMREKVKKIYPIDLLHDTPIAELDCKYDVITTSLCFESTARNKLEYGDIVCKVAKMLNPGGHLVIVGVLGEDCYVVGDFKFSCLNIGENDIKECLEAAGFAIKNWKVLKNQDILQNEVHDIITLEGLFGVVAEKL